MDAALNKLTEASGSLAQKMYAEQAQQAGGEAGPEATAGEEKKADDGVVDAEFEEVKDDKK
jgi:molecular chaperone DnaK